MGELIFESINLIPKTELIPGSYTLKIMWTFKDKDYQVDYDVIWK